MTKASRTSKLLPYHIIVEATAGNVETINIVLKHFEGYIFHTVCLCGYAQFDECEI